MNTLYYGDNLEIMREYVPDESVDLIYLDPPFNFKQAYNVIFRGKEGRYPPNQVEVFEDTCTKAPPIKREKGKEHELPLEGS